MLVYFLLSLLRRYGGPFLMDVRTHVAIRCSILLTILYAFFFDSLTTTTPTPKTIIITTSAHVGPEWDFAIIVMTTCLYYNNNNNNNNNSDDNNRPSTTMMMTPGYVYFANLVICLGMIVAGTLWTILIPLFWDKNNTNTTHHSSMISSQRVIVYTCLMILLFFVIIIPCSIQDSTATTTTTTTRNSRNDLGSSNSTRRTTRKGRHRENNQHNNNNNNTTVMTIVMVIVVMTEVIYTSLLQNQSILNMTTKTTNDHKNNRDDPSHESIMIMSSRRLIQQQFLWNIWIPNHILSCWIVIGISWCILSIPPWHSSMYQMFSSGTSQPMHLLSQTLHHAVQSILQQQQQQQQDDDKDTLKDENDNNIDHPQVTSTTTTTTNTTTMTAAAAAITVAAAIPQQQQQQQQKVGGFYKQLAMDLFHQTNMAGMSSSIVFLGTLGQYEISPWYPTCSLSTKRLLRLGHDMDDTIYSVCYTLWTMSELDMNHNHYNNHDDDINPTTTTTTTNRQVVIRQLTAAAQVAQAIASLLACPRKGYAMTNTSSTDTANLRDAMVRYPQLFATGSTQGTGASATTTAEGEVGERSQSQYPTNQQVRKELQQALKHQLEVVMTQEEEQQQGTTILHDNVEEEHPNIFQTMLLSHTLIDLVATKHRSVRYDEYYSHAAEHTLEEKEEEEDQPQQQHYYDRRRRHHGDDERTTTNLPFLVQPGGTLGKCAVTAMIVQESWKDPSSFRRILFHMSFMEQIIQFVMTWWNGVLSWSSLLILFFQKCQWSKPTMFFLHPRNVRRTIQILIGTCGIFAIDIWWDTYSAWLGTSNTTGHWTMLTFLICLRPTTDETLNFGLSNAMGSVMGGILSWGIHSATVDTMSNGIRFAVHIVLTFVLTWFFFPPSHSYPSSFVFTWDPMAFKILGGVLFTYHLTNVSSRFPYTSSSIASVVKARIISQVMGSFMAVLVSVIILPWYGIVQARETLISFQRLVQTAIQDDIATPALEYNIQQAKSNLLQSQRDIMSIQQQQQQQTHILRRLIPFLGLVKYDSSTTSTSTTDDMDSTTLLLRKLMSASMAVTALDTLLFRAHSYPLSMRIRTAMMAAVATAETETPQDITVAALTFLKEDIFAAGTTDSTSTNHEIQRRLIVSYLNIILLREFMVHNRTDDIRSNTE